MSLRRLPRPGRPRGEGDKTPPEPAPPNAPTFGSPPGATPVPINGAVPARANAPVNGTRPGFAASPVPVAAAPAAPAAVGAAPTATPLNAAPTAPAPVPRQAAAQAAALVADNPAAGGAAPGGPAAVSGAAHGGSAPANGSASEGPAAVGGAAQGGSTDGAHSPAAANGGAPAAASGGLAANGSASGGSAANGATAGGPAANGAASGGSAANGAASGGTAANGSAQSGPAANGSGVSDLPSDPRGASAAEAGVPGVLRPSDAVPAVAGLDDGDAFVTPGAGTGPAAVTGLGADTAAELDALRRRLDGAAATNIGFPATTGFDYSALAPFFARYMLNNLGDPYTDGAYPIHTKPMEREVVDTVADLFGAPADDRWGYVTSGATEGTEYALHLARTLHPDAVVYHSAAAHHSVTNAIGRLGMMSVAIRADALGEIDYDDLADQVDRHRIRPAIVIANIGTAVTEAVDDVAMITQVLDSRAVHRRWIHGDAALAGLPLALLDPDDRPAIDFAAGLDSVVTSGHKFLGAPVPCAVVVVRNSHRQAHARFVTYTGSPDTTVANSRSGLAALVLWYALRTHGLEGLRQRADQARQLAAAAHEALREIGWPAHRHRHALTVSFPTPPAAVTAKWVLATHGANSLIVCMPGVTAAQIDAFVADLRAAITPAGAVAPPPPGIEKRRGLRRHMTSRF
ncbi:histidine decarboxylase [Spirilliplanes yamanashiensis]|uniref:Histidine decarboxylase n=1 Tax=Spirilliplanes yamanashiensis TaxID=42233 RepID=A0A8J3YAE3_9ACTN|nr:histidine decarboxylase [Spirilliplanes yamanashiensis]MDP9817575.1 glutamate/tyrosine decarboxylase-like PLP-dependent enzyme [Spirilliplanes yamanashiensis]GIJ04385.1 hypothetical protein Sya03_37370 [Spirilliplanes yamanashiensis]